jgi:Cys-rich radical ribosomally synthesized peptide
MDTMIITPSAAHYGQLFGDFVAADGLSMARCACVSCNSCTCACACRSGDQPDWDWLEE